MDRPPAPRRKRLVWSLIALGLAIAVACFGTVSIAGRTVLGADRGRAAGAVGVTGADTPAPPVTAPPAPRGLDRTDVDAWLDGVLPAALERTGIPGASVAVVRDGKVLTTRGYGDARKVTAARPAVPVDGARTLFRMGSVSKLVTATAVMQLVERGDLDLDVDVRRYLDFAVPRRFDRPITLRTLLTHTAGFEEQFGGLMLPTGTTPDLREVLSAAPPEQVFEPGTTPAYSNYGNALAGYVVQRVSGERFEDYVREHVFARAGMDTATFDQPLPAALRPRMAAGYADDTSPARPFESVGVAPAGAMTASATDMARFALAQLGHAGPGGPLMGERALEQMRRPALGADTLGTLAGGPRMGLGFFGGERNGHRVVGHGGDTRWFHAQLELYPDDDTGIVVALNGSGREATDSGDLREDLLAGFADRYFPGDLPAGTVDRATTEEHARAAAGTYEISRRFESTFLRAMSVQGHVTVTPQDGGRLRFDPGPLSSRPEVYEEVAPWVWRQVGGDKTIAMRAEDGRVTAISSDSAFTYLPVPVSSSTPVVLTVAGASTAVLVLGLLAWPVGALVRRWQRSPRPRREGRWARVATRVAAACAVVALVAWGFVLASVVGYREVPTAGIRVVQALQLIGVLGLAPAVLRLVLDGRRRAGWRSLVAGTLMLAALAGTAWTVVVLGLLSPSVTY